MVTKTLQLLNPLTEVSQQFLNDPYPTLEKLRLEAPVYWSPADRYWIISRHADASFVLKDPTFEKQIQNWKHAPNPILVSLIPHIKSISHVSKNWLLNLNSPDHGRVRSLLNKAFTGSIVQGLRPKISSIAADLLARVDQKPAFDLMQDYAVPLPMAVIGYMLGIPENNEQELKHWSTKLAAAAGRNKDLKVLTQSGKAVEELSKFLKPLIEARRKNPTDDLLSILVSAEVDGTQLKVDELVGNCILLLVAGHETTTNLIGNAMLCLLRHPEQMALIRSNPNLMASMTAEVLRYESPVQSAPRLATKDILLSDQKIKAGDMCWSLIGSANRDSDVFEDPDRFDITKTPNNQNLSFGAGMHRCIGASLAEVELELAMKALFEWRPEFKLQQQVIDFRTPFGLRGPHELLLRI